MLYRVDFVGNPLRIDRIDSNCIRLIQVLNTAARNSGVSFPVFCFRQTTLSISRTLAGVSPSLSNFVRPSGFRRPNVDGLAIGTVASATVILSNEFLLRHSHDVHLVSDGI
jgi:hypothetical protein